MGNLSGKKVIVVGASRGIGRAIATAFADAGAKVIAVSRTAASYPTSFEGSGSIHGEIADAAEAAVPASIIDRYEADVIVLVAGALPHMRPLRQQTWETFSVNWESDVRVTFHWLREILLKPLRPGSRVIVISSGAALGGSPLSGGYAGAKSTQRFLSAYAQDESTREGLGITFCAVLPRFSPDTGVGRPAVRAYADRTGQTVEAFLKATIQSGGPLVSPEIAGAALVGLVQEEAGKVAPAYLLGGDGLKRLG